MRKEDRSETVSQLEKNKLFQTRLVRMQMSTGIPPTAGLFSDQMHWLATEAPSAGLFSYQSHWLPAATALPPTSYSSPGDLSIDPYHDTHKGNSGDELRVNGNLPDKEKRRNLEFDLRRPNSRKDSIRGFNSRGYFDRDSGEQPLQSARDGQLPPATKYGQFRPMGVRNNFLSGQQIPQQRAPQPPPPTTCRSEQDDLVAMGTNWNSLNTHRGGRSFTNGNSTLQLLQAGGPARKVGSRSSITGLNGNYRNHCNKDTEPRYPDPFIGAPHGFQQRIAELASLEAETIRKEKTSKAKKKAKAEKDS